MEDGAPAPFSVRYDGRTGEIFGLSLRVGLLTIVTLGIYRFWATTRVRRWFWSRVTVGDERLEYSGTGLELFVAFIKVALLLAIVLIPLRIAINFYGPSLWLAGFISAAQILFLAFLYVFAIYYARRYRLTRTQWHGIRANLVGSSLEYFWLNLGYLLLTLVTLGVAYPYYRVATARYLLDHTWFGDQKFSCTARARNLMVRWLIYLAIGVVLMGFIGFQIRDLVVAQKSHSVFAMGMAGGRLVATYLLAILLAGFFFIAYRVAEFRLLTGSLTFQNVRVSSNLGAARMLLFAVMLYGIALLWMIALGIVVAIVVAIVTHAVGAQLAPVPGHVNPAAILPFVLIIPFYILAISVFTRAYYYNGLLQRMVGSLSFDGAPDLAHIGQTTAPIPRWGEGMLEAFDFAG